MKIRAITPATVIASLALLFALSGTAVAGALITGANVKNNSIAGIDILNESLGSKDVKNGSLLPKDFKPGALPVGGQGPAGPAGPQGPGGPQGPAGQNGVAGVEIVHATTAADSDGEKTATAACPAGKKVVGGGGYAAGFLNYPDQLAIVANYPAQLDQLARCRAGDDRVRRSLARQGVRALRERRVVARGPVGGGTGRRVRPAACFRLWAHAIDVCSCDDERPRRRPLRVARGAARGGPAAPSRGRLVTYSPKVFIPLTTLCRDVCGYCTFARPPRRGERAFMTEDEVLAIARAGAAAGCREALFTLGDKPELRYKVAREELRALGCATTLEYLARCARLVLEETGLLPHLNPGVMTRAELEALRPVSASMGIMLETTAERLSREGRAALGVAGQGPGAAPRDDPARRRARGSRSRAGSSSASARRARSGSTRCSR